MAILALKSDLMTNIDAFPPVKNLNNRSQAFVVCERFQVAALSAVADIGSRLRLCQLPPRARYLGNLSRLKWSAYGAGCLLSLGWERYRQPNGVWVAEDVDGLGASLNVAAAGQSVLDQLTSSVDEMEFTGMATLILVNTGAVIPIGATLSGVICYGLP